MMSLFLLQDSGWWCPMCGGMDGLWGWGMMFFMALFWIAVLVAVVWLIVRLAGSRGDGFGGGSESGRAEEILRERYARGEIDREAFERMKDDLRRG